MRKTDLRLRSLAEAGHRDAAVELGLKYLNGAPGLAANPRHALALLRPALDRPEIAEAVATAVNIETLIETQTEKVLELAALDEDATAAAKLGALMVLRGDSAGWSWLSSAGRATNTTSDRALAELLRTEAFRDGRTCVEAVMREAPNTEHFWRVLAACAEAFPTSTILGHAMLRLFKLGPPSACAMQWLPAKRIQRCLSNVADEKDATANYVLGCALVGQSINDLSANALVTRTNHRQGFARLLRSAQYGEQKAWYRLFIASSDHRSSIANRDAANFFLEQAAESEIPEACRVLGARLLRESNELSGQLRGQRLLHVAMLQGDNLAKELLGSFFGSQRPRDADANSERVIMKAELLDPGLGLQVLLARTFGLTREECFELDLGACSFGPSLILNARYALPAYGEDALEALRKTRAWLKSSPTSTSTRALHANTLLDAILETEGLESTAFFNEADASARRTFRGWKLANANLLQSAGRVPSA